MEDPGYEVRDLTRFVTNGTSVTDENKQLFLCPVDDNFFDFYGIPIVAGNDFPHHTQRPHHDRPDGR